MRSSAANGGPDILIGDNDWSGKLAESGLIATIFDESSQNPAEEALFSQKEEGIFGPETLAALRLGKKIYAWPESVEIVVLYYNKAILPHAPQSIEEMVRLAGKHKPPEGYGLVFNTAFYFFAGYFLGGGAQIFDPSGHVVVESPEGKKMLEWLSSIQRAPGVLLTNDYGKADSLYKQGKAAMILNGPWAMADYQKVLGAKLGLATLPKLANGQSPAPWIGVKCLMLNANSDRTHKQMAAEFFRFVASPEIQVLLAKGCGHIPANQTAKLPAGSLLQTFSEQAKTGTPKLADPLLAVVWDPLDRAIQEVLLGKSSPAKALATAKKLIVAKLEAIQNNRQ
jgi:arabinogalactan oligomer/maltooligosaccharide transport system substrate-binding protein